MLYYHPYELEKSRRVAASQQWEGDANINFLSAIKSARRLLLRVEELERQVKRLKSERIKLLEGVRS